MLPRILLVALILGSTIEAQNSTIWNWNANTDRTNRFEGLATVKVALPQFELLSFTGQFDTFKPDARLNVSFFLPGPRPVRLLARELKDDKYYRMEAKQRKWSAGRWHTFGPWESATVIDAERIPHRNIGVVVHLDDDIHASGWLAPAFVHAGPAAKGVNTYSLVFRTRANLNSVQYTLRSETSAVAERLLETRFAARAPILLTIDAQPLADGVYALTIVCTPANVSARRIERRYTFHHRGRVNSGPN